MPFPAYLLDPASDLVARNPSFVDLFPEDGATRTNFVELLLCSEAVRGKPVATGDQGIAAGRARVAARVWATAPGAATVDVPTNVARARSATVGALDRRERSMRVVRLGAGVARILDRAPRDGEVPIC